MSTLLDLQPGTIWMQNKTKSNNVNLIIKIEKAPYCKIVPCYGRTTGSRPGYPITKPLRDSDPVIEMITYNHQAKVVYRYLICSSPKHLNKLTEGNANGILYHYSLIHQPNT